MITISVSGASASTPITSITVTLVVCFANDTSSASTSLKGYLYTSSQKPTNASVPSGYIGSGTSGTITTTASGKAATFTISGLNITSNSNLYLKVYQTTNILKQIWAGSTANNITCTTGSVSSTTYYYRCYDVASGTYLTSSTSTTSSSIARPNQGSAYTYLGYVTHTSFS